MKSSNDEYDEDEDDEEKALNLDSVESESESKGEGGENIPCFSKTKSVSDLVFHGQ